MADDVGEVLGAALQRLENANGDDSESAYCEVRSTSRIASGKVAWDCWRFACAYVCDIGPKRCHGGIAVASCAVHRKNTIEDAEQCHVRDLGSTEESNL